MEYDKIKQLIDDMGNSKLTSISIDFPDGTKISMSKLDEDAIKVINTLEKNNDNKKEDVNEIKSEEIEKEEKKEEKIEGNIITSPMVGTFYSKPSPTSEPYVEVGKRVNKGDTVCIVEAMKLMNEIESEFSGEIVEVFLEDGKPVEYGTPLFRIK